MFSHQGVFTCSKQSHHKCCLFATVILFHPFKWQMIQRIHIRIFCLAHGLKVLNLGILFLLLSQLGLVTKQRKYLISFANSYILIEVASVHEQCCQHGTNAAPTPAFLGRYCTPLPSSCRHTPLVLLHSTGLSWAGKGMSLLDLFIETIF